MDPGPHAGGGGLVPMGPFCWPMEAGEGLLSPGGIMLSSFLKLLDCPLGNDAFPAAAPPGNGGRCPPGIIELEPALLCGVWPRGALPPD
jgi:hypothetical protein